MVLCDRIIHSHAWPSQNQKWFPFRLIHGYELAACPRWVRIVFWVNEWLQYRYFIMKVPDSVYIGLTVILVEWNLMEFLTIKRREKELVIVLFVLSVDCIIFLTQPVARFSIFNSRIHVRSIIYLISDEIISRWFQLWPESITRLTPLFNKILNQSKCRMPALTNLTANTPSLPCCLYLSCY